MRTEKEMMDLIIDLAKSDDRILAAYLKGSRTNPHVPKDRYQDFDVMYVVTETHSFIQDTSWMNRFGTVALMQEQDTDFGYGARFHIQNHYDESYSWLLLFDDGNRIDVGIELLPVMESGRNRNKLFLPLLDKTGCLPQLPPEFYEAYKNTYSDGDYEHLWASIHAACQLFRETALLVAQQFHFVYPEQEEQASQNYIRRIQASIQ